MYFRIVALDVTEVDTRATPSLVSIDLSLVRGGSVYTTTRSRVECFRNLNCVLLIDPVVILSSNTISISISAVLQRSGKFG